MSNLDNCVQCFFQNCNLTSYYSQPKFFSDVSGLHDAESKVAVSTTTTPKPFIYLVQTEQCLPQDLASSTRMGDSKTCNCDVIVLSYKEECQDKNSSHISYIFAKKTTWTQGRNLLYFVAKERTPHYHYYIFMDDDIYLEFNSYSSDEMKKMTPNRAFEKWLLDDEPAIGITGYNNYHNRAEVLLERRERICKNTDSSPVIPAVWFDACFNAFHHQAIEHILPYDTQYDRDSWWISQKWLFYLAEVMFRGQVLENIAITVSNGKHRDYPRGQPKKMKEILVVEEIQKKTPRAYQNCSLFGSLKVGDLSHYTESTDTYCLNKKHRHPIVPFSHFKEKC